MDELEAGDPRSVLATTPEGIMEVFSSFPEFESFIISGPCGVTASGVCRPTHTPRCLCGSDEAVVIRG